MTLPSIPGLDRARVRRRQRRLDCLLNTL